MPVEEFCEDLGRSLWKPVDEEMSPGQGRLGHVRAALAPLGRNVKQLRHLARRTIEDERGTGDLAADIGDIMLEVDARSGTIVGARPMNHARVTPCPTIFRNHLLIKVRNPRGSPSDEAGLVEIVGVIADQALREGLRLREKVPM